MCLEANRVDSGEVKLTKEEALAYLSNMLDRSMELEAEKTGKTLKQVRQELVEDVKKFHKLGHIVGVNDETAEAMDRAQKLVAERDM